MAEDNVLELNLTVHMARQMLCEIASQRSHRVIITSHAQEQMADRGISDKQVFCCLKNGRFKDEPFWSHEHKNWQMTLETVSAGDVVGVAAALSHDNRGNKIIVITAFISGRM